MSKKRALDAVLAAHWAITPEYLDLIASIAEREHEFAGNLEALESKLGRPLGNTMTASIRDGIATIPVEGPLFKRASWFQAISGATDYTNIARDLTAALEDPAVRGVMLQIDSPGGEVAGITDLVAMIRAAGKPVWAHIDGTGASAAYWIASAADKVIASPSAVIGSVGVQIGMKLAEPRAGEKSYRFVSSQSPLKNAGPDTEAGAQQIQTLVDDLAAVFIESAASNMGVSIDHALANFGQGSVMVASKALDAGMITSISTFESAFAALKSEIVTMEWKDLTAQALAENRPDLVASIRTEALATVEQVDAAAIRTEAAKAERERILAIQGLSMPGAEDVIAKAIAEGTDQNATAVHVLKAVQGKQAAAGAAALENIKGAEKAMTPPNASGEGDELTDEQKGIASMEALRKAGVIR
jgi:capsid assembly protease